MRTVLVTVLVLTFVICAKAYDGEDGLNLIVVGEKYKLRQIEEVKDFFGLAVEEENTIAFVLTLDDKAWQKDPRSIWHPLLVLRKDGEAVASVHLHVQHHEEEQELLFQWTAVPDFDEDSYFLIQMYANSMDSTMLQIPFSSAKVFRVSKDKKRHSTSIAELRLETKSEKEPLAPVK